MAIRKYQAVGFGSALTGISQTHKQEAGKRKKNVRSPGHCHNGGVTGGGSGCVCAGPSSSRVGDKDGEDGPANWQNSYSVDPVVVTAVTAEAIADCLTALLAVPVMHGIVLKLFEKDCF